MYRAMTIARSPTQQLDHERGFFYSFNVVAQLRAVDLARALRKQGA